MNTKRHANAYAHADAQYIYIYIYIYICVCVKRKPQKVGIRTKDNQSWESLCIAVQD